MTCPDDTVKRSVKKIIHPGEWDFEEQRPKKNKDLNRFLDEIEQSIIDLKLHCKHVGILISADLVNSKLDVLLQDTSPKRAFKKAAPRDMITDFRTIINEMRAVPGLTYGKQKKRYQESTVVQLESAVNMVEQFFKVRGIPPQFSQVTMQTYEAFISWGHENDQSTNYIGSLIKRWKTLAKIARKKGWHNNIIFESDEFVKIEEDTDDIFLTEEKIQAIANTSVGLPIYDIARDWFVLDCYLGLRVSDLLRLSEKDFERDMFQLINQKTGAKVAIPLNPTVRRIIKKYKGLPPSISDVKLNLHIKEVARKAELNALFVYTITKGGVLQTIRYKEWEMVSSHTCRRTFITNLLRMGVPHFQVMKLAGIKSYNTLKKYFKQSAVEVAEDMKNHPYFTGQAATK